VPRVEVNGVSLNYREAGEGFPVVLVHGFTGNLRNWALTVPVLTESFRTVSLDLRGHGLSDKPVREEDYTLEVMASDVLAFLEALGISECYLVGHSMGGMISQHMILSRPELFRALALVDTAAQALPRRNEERARLMRIAREEGMEAAFEEQVRISPQRERMLGNPEFIHVWREQFLMTSLEAFLACGAAMANRTSLVERLHEVRVPTLIVCGEHDAPFLEPSRRMHERLPGSELVIIPGAGHVPQIETPAEFNRVLSGFLSKLHQATAAGG
jgi:3-oxoadipate enol-lactonase